MSIIDCPKHGSTFHVLEMCVECKTESKPPREFWIKNKANEYTDDQFWATEKEEYDTDIHVIEKKAVQEILTEIAELIRPYSDPESLLICVKKDAIRAQKAMAIINEVLNGKA